MGKHGDNNINHDAQLSLIGGGDIDKDVLSIQGDFGLVGIDSGASPIN